MKIREYILARFRLPSASRNGGVSTAQIYGGAGNPFALALIDAELIAMRKEGVLGCAKELWFLRGVNAGSGPARSRLLKGPIDRRADQKQLTIDDQIMRRK